MKRRSAGMRGGALLGLIGALVLSGCATTKPLPLSQEEFTAAMEVSSVKVDGLVEENKRDEAVGLLARLAEDNPARKEPWVRLARIHFDAGAYGQAIVAADEALQRDQDDRTAKSVRAVSGLRVATASLAELRADAELKGSAEADAVSLAKGLRETLGEDVLVPVVAPDLQAKYQEAITPKPVPRKRVRRTYSQPSASAVPAPSGQKPNAATTGGNPFGVLK